MLHCRPARFVKLGLVEDVKAARQAYKLGGRACAKEWFRNKGGHGKGGKGKGRGHGHPWGKGEGEGKGCHGHPWGPPPPPPASPPPLRRLPCARGCIGTYT